MGDRNNPIKFGPEWLRNLPGKEPTTSTSNQSVATTAGSSATCASNNSQQSSNNVANPYNLTQSSSRVLLAKLRYGREEMLALYDRNATPPPELKTFDLLYQVRGKPPFALSNTLEEEMRENLRSAPPAGMASGDRFGPYRGRAMNVSTIRVFIGPDTRSKRGSSTRQTNAGRGYFYSNAHRNSGFNGEDDSNTTIRPRLSSSSTNGQSQVRPTDSEWVAKNQRNRRPNTNWRQSYRDDSEEWRSTDTNRNKNLENRDNWGVREERRRPYGWDAQHNEELPEWAVENSEAFAGTFDSSGAFHGYSNDDINLPKSTESSYPLSKSHTHSSFTRSRSSDEGAESWWASEKAKKLSPKRFDANNIKFKKVPNNDGNETGIISGNTTNKGARSKTVTFREPMQEIFKKKLPSPPPVATDTKTATTSNTEDQKKKKFTESKTFDDLMRSDINIEGVGEERGKFQSVMLPPNNSLRQKHQNIVTSVTEEPQSSNLRAFKLAESLALRNEQMANKSEDEKMLDSMFNMSLDPSKSYYNSNLNEASIARGDRDNVAVAMSQLSNPIHMVKNVEKTDRDAIKPMSSDNSMKCPDMQPMVMQNAGLNAPMPLPLDPASFSALMMQPPPVIQPSMNNHNMIQSGMPSGLSTLNMSGFGSNMMQPNMAGLSGFQGNSNMPNMPNNDGNNSLFFNQNNNGMNNPVDLQIANQLGQNMYSMHGMQQSNPQAASVYNTMMQQTQGNASQSNQKLLNEWYYEDPKKTIQGPFSSKEMYNWYLAGFFSPSLMVRRACELGMRPLGSYGPVVPFVQMDMISPTFVMPGFEQQMPRARDNMMNTPSGLGNNVKNMPTDHSKIAQNIPKIQNIPNMQNSPNATNMQHMPNNLDMPNMSNMPTAANMNNFPPVPNVPNMPYSVIAPLNPMPMTSLGIVRQPFPGQSQTMESLWAQPGLSADYVWMQQAMNNNNNMRVNNLPMYFWGNQNSGVTSNSLLPEDITKEMKTEDEILAHLRVPQPPPFIEPPASPILSKSQDAFTNVSATPNLEELEKLIQKESLVPPSPPINKINEVIVQKAPLDKFPIIDPIVLEPGKPQILVKNTETKTAKQTKADVELKAAKGKETNVAKSKTKKAKDEKKEEPVEQKPKEEESSKTEKQSAESLPSLVKKEDKLNYSALKKSLDRERKEWIKDGFTIVKGADKATKDTKKKAEEVRVSEEAERKRKEEERLAAEDEKRKRQADILRKQQQQQEQQQARQVSESVMKKAPWSAVTNHALQATNKDGLSLAEIQRLEREKKLEQMKEQQQMMQIIAQQQAAALAREQEMQANVGWAKKGTNMPSAGQSLTDIQTETWKQATAIAQATSQQVVDEPSTPTMTPLQANISAPWANTQNGGGFWDTQPNQPAKQEKPQEAPKPVEPAKTKKKVVLVLPKKENSPTVDFENWCTNVLAPWSSKIDVPTFVGFLKDIESPYEVKDYVKFYLGDTKESNDFCRQFLERRSKLLRVGMVTLSDDLCSPAIAVNPRSLPNSDFQEVKGKGKKTKKNKMLKVDARILGFSVTAAEDRINVGDIDTV